MSARPGADVEDRLEVLEVFVVAPEDGLDAFVGQRNLARDSG
jgi:hypothetical protein